MAPPFHSPFHSHPTPPRPLILDPDPTPVPSPLPADPDALRLAARDVLDRDVFDHLDGGADAEVTRRANATAWDDWWLRPRMLRSVTTADVSTEVLGTRLPSPVFVAPMAAHGLVTPDAEVATAGGAADAGCGFVASTLSTLPIETIREATDGPLWFQLYVFHDRDGTPDLVDRALATGIGALVLTVDAPGLGHKRRDAANGFEIRARATYGNLAAGTPPPTQARDLTLDDVTALAEQAEDVPVLVKGVLRADDARRCLDAGAAGVIVSNHGGRQVDGAVPTAHALPEVAPAAADHAVLVDGGIDGPDDVVRALALGADAVLVGRPVLWAAAVGGRDGVSRWLTDLVDGIERALRLCGVAGANDVPPDLVTLRAAQGSRPTGR